MEAYYDSDDDVCWGPVTVRELRRDLTICPREKITSRITIECIPSYKDTRDYDEKIASPLELDHFEKETSESISREGGASENVIELSSDDDNDDDVKGGASSKLLSVSPPSVVMFVKDGSMLVGTIDLKNIDTRISISYKIKRSHKKFWLNSVAGCLTPGSEATIRVMLVPGCQLDLSRDKFLVMSVPVESVELTPQDLAKLWKNVSNKSVTEHKLCCAQNDDNTKNENAYAVDAILEIGKRIKELTDTQAQNDDNTKNENAYVVDAIQEISKRIKELTDTQARLQSIMEHIHLLLMVTLGALFLFMTVTMVLIYNVYSEVHDMGSSLSCSVKPAPNNN